MVLISCGHFHELLKRVFPRLLKEFAPKGTSDFMTLGHQLGGLSERSCLCFFELNRFVIYKKDLRVHVGREPTFL